SSRCSSRSNRKMNGTHSRHRSSRHSNHHSYRCSHGSRNNRCIRSNRYDGNPPLPCQRTKPTSKQQNTYSNLLQQREANPRDMERKLQGAWSHFLRILSHSEDRPLWKAGKLDHPVNIFRLQRMERIVKIVKKRVNSSLGRDEFFPSDLAGFNGEAEL